MSKPRDMTAGELLRATRNAGFDWVFFEGVVHAEVPIKTTRRERVLVDSLWREATRRGQRFEGFVELTLYAEGK